MTGEALRVLVIEDDKADADLVVHAVEETYPGTQVDVVATRRDFIGLLARGKYDLVLADFRLGEWTGMDALNELRRLRFAVPLIIVTGALGDECAVDCVKAGAADYVLKNNLARLPMVMKRALDEKRSHDETLRAQELMRDAQRVTREQEIALKESADRALEDMTERRALENQFRQAQKMEAVGRLAGGVAHDFNNLLTVITGYTDMSISDLGLDDPRRADLQEVRKAADAAASLTRQLLAFSRLQVIEPKVISLEDVVTQAHKLLLRLIGEDIDLATRFGARPSVVHMDPGQLEQVIMNLAVNARDAMPTGGKLTIETAVVDLDDAYAAAHWPATTGRYAMLAVSDTGCGMDDATRDRIFEPFFTTKQSGEGTGLGLATVYGIVKQSGGFIWAYSEPGNGATFKIYLPLCDDAPTSVRDEKRLPAPRGTETVLVVEDSTAVRNIVQRALEQQGYEVIATASPNAALELAAELDRPVHLLLTDVVMPEMSGRVLAEKFATVQPDAKILYMSGYTDDAVIRHGVLSAKTPFLQKPFTPLVLAARVREALDRV